MKYFQFKKWPKEEKPYFKEWDSHTNKITWVIKWVFYNQPKDVTTKEWKSVTIPANVNLVLENEQSVSFSIELGWLFRTTMNSLLSANIWDTIELYTFINKDWFKTISITNPTKKKEITTKENKVVTVNEAYPWVYNLKTDVPEVEVIKNKKWEFVSADDADANNFFIEKIKERFGKKEEWITETDLDKVFG